MVYIIAIIINLILVILNYVLGDYELAMFCSGEVVGLLAFMLLMKGSRV